MGRGIRFVVFLFCLVVSGAACGEGENLLKNAGFEVVLFEDMRGNEEVRRSTQSVSGWETEKYGDIVAAKPETTQLPRTKAAEPDRGVVAINSGKKFWQFMTLPEIGCGYGDAVSLAVKGYQAESKALAARIFLMRVDSEDGTWKPKEFGMFENRTFAKHGRGELVRELIGEAHSGDDLAFLFKAENAEIAGQVKQGKESSKESTNAVGIVVEFENLSKKQVLLTGVSLVKGAKAVLGGKEVRPLPTYYRRVPRVMQKLWKGEALHILTLGSSVDHGDANPPLYLYDDDAKSATYKRPLVHVEQTPMVKLGKPEWADYVAETRSAFVYTGRLRFDLMTRYGYSIDRILLNLTAGGGSSIGEAHAGYGAWGDLAVKPGPHNGHSSKKTWEELYPAVFKRGGGTRPDLIVFGHGENEHVDGADEVAVFEGAIRLFQRKYPGVETVFCIWPRDGKVVHDEEKLKALAEHYGIPYIDVMPTIKGIYKTCNSYAICPDGGHPQAGWHFIWSKLLGQLFECGGKLEEWIPQKQLPARRNEHAALWEGDAKTFEAGSARIVGGNKIVLEDCAFVAWAQSKDANKVATLLVDGKEVKAGSGRSFAKRDLWNSSFVHGKLTLGDRHIVEVVGEDVKLVALDSKVCLKREWIGVESERWKRGGAGGKLPAPEAVDFQSEWGAPFGAKKVELAAGQAVELEVQGTDFSVAYVDRKDGGTLRVTVDGEVKLEVGTDVAFVDAAKKEWWMENRKGIRGLPFKKHKVRVEAVGGGVSLLGLVAYDGRS
jgi:hypothetical protein